MTHQEMIELYRAAGADAETDTDSGSRDWDLAGEGT